MSSLDKAFSALSLIADEARPLGLTEIVSRLALPKPTVRRLLLGLMEHGLVHQNPAHKYEVGNAFMDLAATALAQGTLLDYSQEVLRDLRKKVSGTLMVSRLTDHDLQHSVQVDSTSENYVVAPPSDAPLHATAAGKAILASLPVPDIERLTAPGFRRFTSSTLRSSESLMAELTVVRARGFATEDEEYRAGVRAVAAPILTFVGRPVGTLSLLTPAKVLSMPEMLRAAPYVAAAATQISEQLGGMGVDGTRIGHA